VRSVNFLPMTLMTVADAIAELQKLRSDLVVMNFNPNLGETYFLKGFKVESSDPDNEWVEVVME
jgi:hypothetical protein